MARTLDLWQQREPGLAFTNLVDFDTVYGHRRDVRGYAAALAEFDAWLGGLLPHCSPDDLVILTADHGNDPTFRGTDHTREVVPVLMLCGDAPRNLGVRDTLADVGATLADWFHAGAPSVGVSLLSRSAEAPGLAA